MGARSTHGDSRPGSGRANRGADAPRLGRGHDRQSHPCYLHRRSELALLHNLGITTSYAVAVSTVPAILLEAVLVMLLP